MFVIASKAKQSYTKMMLYKHYYVYILTNKTNRTLYCGITDDLIKRIYQHKEHFDLYSFTAKYHIDKLVFYEIYDDPENAIMREKQIKAGSRKKKIVLIESVNPEWKDLFDGLLG